MGPIVIHVCKIERLKTAAQMTRVVFYRDKDKDSNHKGGITIVGISCEPGMDVCIAER